MHALFKSFLIVRYVKETDISVHPSGIIQIGATVEGLQMPIVTRSSLIAVHQATWVVLLKNHLVRIARQLPADTEPISLHPVLGKNACLPAVYVKEGRTAVVAGRGTDLQGKLLVNAPYGPFVSTTRMHLAPNLVHGDSSGR